MRLARLLVVGVIACTLALAFVIDRNDRPTVRIVAPTAHSVPMAIENGVWFCPGGSNPEGVAEVGIELINVGSEPVTAVVAGVRSGTGAEPRETREVVAVGERRSIPLADLVTESDWMGAIVEVESGELVVEQTYVGRPAEAIEGSPVGTDRAPCHSRTSTTWVAASGATREEQFGEQMYLLVLNPFLEDAVLDIVFDSDVGVESVPGVVVPARRVVAVDITQEVTVASRVSAVIDVVAGRVAVSRLQLFDGEGVSGLAVTPASADVSPVWFLPVVHRDSRNDVVTVVNPSRTETAEVDLEIIADGDTEFDPVLLTIRPGRAARVPLVDEARLEGVETMSIVARSLTGVPVAVMNESSLPLGDGRVTNFSATVGADAAATRWVAPLETDAGGVVLYNPSATGISNAVVSVLEDGELVFVADVELAPKRRAVVLSADIGGDRPVVVIEASEPIVVGRELSDVSLHAQMTAVISGAEAVALD